MAKTIRQIADELGVSKTAVMNKIENLGLRSKMRKNGNHFAIDENQENLIKAEFLQEKPQTANRKPVVEHSQTANHKSQTIFASSEVENSLIEMLKNELKIKNKQIEQLNNLIVQLNNQVAQLTAALENTTSALTAAQALHAADKKQLLIEGDAEVSERRHWWQRKKK